MRSFSRTYSDRPCVKCGVAITGLKGPQRYCAPCKGSCSVDGCARTVRSKGICSYHGRPRHPVAAIEPRGNNCGIHNCGRKAKIKGMCQFHYDRVLFSGDAGGAEPAATTAKGAPCLVDGCEKPGIGRGYCQMHYRRLQTKGDAGCAEMLIAARGQGSITATGYRIFRSASNKTIYEHRMVMEETLGRAMKRGENVHHIDGDRLNNEPSNLELWTTQQPAGQRVADRVDAAIALIRQHEELAKDRGFALVQFESQAATDLLFGDDFMYSEVFAPTISLTVKGN